MLRMGVIVCKTWKLEISEKHFEIKLHLIFNESVALSHACFILANIYKSNNKYMYTNKSLALTTCFNARGSRRTQHALRPCIEEVDCEKTDTLHMSRK